MAQAADLIYPNPASYTIRVTRWCFGLAIAIALLTVIVNDVPEGRALLEFLTGTWPGTSYGDLFTANNRLLLFAGVFLRVFAISFIPIVLGALAVGFLRREVMRILDIIHNRDELIKAALRAKLADKEIDPKTIDDALEAGFKDADKEWSDYIQARSRVGKRFFEQEA